MIPTRGPIHTGCRALGFALAALVLTIVSGCGSAPNTTRMSIDDLDAMSAEMAQSLQSGLFAQRGPHSPPMVIAIDKAENYSTELIPVNERWQIMQRLRSSQPIVDLRNNRNVSFTIPRDELDSGRTGDEAGLAARRAPSHTMEARFMSLRRAGGQDTTMLYTCEFRITDLSSGEIVWTDTFDFKKAASGLGYN